MCFALLAAVVESAEVEQPPSALVVLLFARQRARNQRQRVLRQGHPYDRHN
jgi:hypothetical protein